MFARLLISLKLRQAEFHQQIQYDYMTATTSMGSTSHKSGILEVSGNKKQIKMKKLAPIEFTAVDKHKIINVALLPVVNLTKQQNMNPHMHGAEKDQKQKNSPSTYKHGQRNLKNSGYRSSWMGSSGVNTAIRIKDIMKSTYNRSRYLKYPLFNKGQLFGSINIKIKTIQSHPYSNSNYQVTEINIQQQRKFMKAKISQQVIIINPANMLRKIKNNETDKMSQKYESQRIDSNKYGEKSYKNTKKQTYENDNEQDIELATKLMMIDKKIMDKQKNNKHMGPVWQEIDEEEDYQNSINTDENVQDQHNHIFEIQERGDQSDDNDDPQQQQWPSQYQCQQ